VRTHDRAAGSVPPDAGEQPGHALPGGGITETRAERGDVQDGGGRLQLLEVLARGKDLRPVHPACVGRAGAGVEP
jgi:hypothetical protein